MRIAITRTEGKIDVLVASFAEMKACNERVQNKIEDLENNSRINIMKDIITKSNFNWENEPEFFSFENKPKEE